MCITSCTRFCSDQIKYHQNSTFVMRKIGCFVNQEALLVVLLGGSVLKVDLSGVVNEKWSTLAFVLQVILEGLFVFKILVYCCYLVEIYPSQNRISMLITSQLHTFLGQGWISCIYGGTSCSLTGGLSYEG